MRVLPYNIKRNNIFNEDEVSKMEMNKSIGLVFYLYVVTIIGGGSLGLYVYAKGYNFLFVTYFIQSILTAGVYYYGKKNDRLEQYSQYWGFIIPFIVIVMMIWVNAL